MKDVLALLGSTLPKALGAGRNFLSELILYCSTVVF
jgi:hypothetical protein